MNAKTGRLLLILGILTVFGMTAVYAQIAVSQPASGAFFYKTQDVQVSFRSTLRGTLNIRLLNDGRVVHNLVSVPSSADHWNWIVGKIYAPDDRIIGSGDRYQIQVQTVDGRIHGESGYFTVALPNVRVGDPNGGERWRRGDTYDVIWHTRNFFGRVKIELWQNDRLFTTLVADMADASPYSWRVFPREGGVGEVDPVENYPNFKIRVSSLRCLEIFDQSDSGFRIVR